MGPYNRNMCESMERLARNSLEEVDVDVVDVSCSNTGYILTIWLDTNRIDKEVFDSLEQSWPNVGSVENTNYTKEIQDVMKVTLYSE